MDFLEGGFVYNHKTRLYTESHFHSITAGAVLDVVSEN